ncbi:MAG: hypothetical protein QXX08_07540 [Candidatus Bathyarchaeia archaeon]
MEPEPVEKCKLVRISLDIEEGCFFLYEDGAIYKALKTGLEMEEAEKSSGFWRRILFALSEAVNEKTEKAEARV